MFSNLEKDIYQVGKYFFQLGNGDLQAIITYLLL